MSAFADTQKIYGGAISLWEKVQAQARVSLRQRARRMACLSVEATRGDFEAAAGCCHAQADARRAPAPTHRARSPCASSC